MKSDIHPKNLRSVLFHDVSSDTRYVVLSTVKTTEKEVFDGVEYDKLTVEISSASHPFYTGETKLMDAAGRADKFKTRAGAAKSAK
jgi:large subunit ribosomal protein L31